MWTIISVGVALSGIGTGGFTLLWQYVAAAERRAEERDARIEKRAEERSAAVERRAEARAAELKAEIQKLADRVDRNHPNLRQAIDTLIINDQAKAADDP